MGIESTLDYNHGAMRCLGSPACRARRQSLKAAPSLASRGKMLKNTEKYPPCPHTIAPWSCTPKGPQTVGEGQGCGEDLPPEAGGGRIKKKEEKMEERQ